jgi:hypothetical protein
LLTDQTLNDLDRYIIEKNKLHNRYLHGWGVVCGLEAVCAPCDKVTVRGGYALSPCGEDIIVCNNVTVNVCELINKCKDKQRHDWECEPFPSGPGQDCVNVEEDWVLTVRYDEKGSRGITALKGSSACCSSCNCGGSSGCGCGSSSSSSCGCGCHGRNGNGGSQKYALATTGATTSRRYEYRPAQETIAAQCEPTLTCEGYVFEVCKPLPVDRDKRNLGAFIERINKCFKRLLDTAPKKPGTNATVAELHAWCCSLKSYLINNLVDFPVYNCRLAQVLAAFSCPDPSQFQTPAAYRSALDASISNHLSIVGAEYIRYCICSAFLPPCPEVVCDPRVPLATVTVLKDNTGNCRVVRVCNIGPRKFLTTFVSLGYWLSFLRPLLDILRRGLELLCCAPFQFRQGGTTDSNIGGTFNSAPAANAAFRPVTTKRGFRAFAGRVWENRTRRVDAQTLFLGAIGFRDANDQPVLAETELANPFYTVAINNFLGPQLAKLPDNSFDILKDAGASLVRRSVDTKGFDSTARHEQEISDLKERVSTLQAAADQQSRLISELHERLGDKR